MTDVISTAVHWQAAEHVTRGASSTARYAARPLARRKTAPPASTSLAMVRVRGAREHNLRGVDVDLPRDQLVVFTGVSGSGKSSLAFGTLYAEAQRRYLESVSPYARRLFQQMDVPAVDAIDGLPPAVALQQQRGGTSSRSSVGSVTTLSNLLRMLYSRAGEYPRGAAMLYAEAFSPNTPEGACPECHGLGRVYTVTEASMVPDPSLTIRQRAIAAWPTAWGGQNQRDILVSLGHDVDVPWRDLPKKTRQWILFTDEQPVVPVYAGYTPAQTKRALARNEAPSYLGTFSSAKRHVLHTFASSPSQKMRARAQAFMRAAECPGCHGKRLRRESLAVRFAGLDIAEIGRLSLARLSALLRPIADGATGTRRGARSPEQAIVAQRIAADLCARLEAVLDLGLGYLTLDRSTPTLSPGELQRLRLGTAVRSNLFGVVYVLDEPSAGLHPADTEALLDALEQLRAHGNSVFVVEHELAVIRRADWIVDVGPGAGERGGEVLYSGPLEGLERVATSKTAQYLFHAPPSRTRGPRTPRAWLQLEGVRRNNLAGIDIAFPTGVLTCVTGVSGSGKSSLVSQVLVELVGGALGVAPPQDDDDDRDLLDDAPVVTTGGRITGGLAGIGRLVLVDQRAIGRTPRSNLATYTGLFDHVRRSFAATKAARARRYDAGRFSFNVAKGRCATCAGEGSVMVELLFLPSVRTKCPACAGARYDAKTLQVEVRGKNIAQVLDMTVDAACEFFADDPVLSRGLGIVARVGLGYLRLGQPATELSGGEAQRIKLATELQRSTWGDALYVLDEPTTGLHPADVQTLMRELEGLVDAGNTVVVVEHDLQIIADADWVIDIGPGAGDAGGTVVAQGTPAEVAKSKRSTTARYLAEHLARARARA
jgi:excinuclease ABC subunit A